MTISIWKDVQCHPPSGVYTLEYLGHMHTCYQFPTVLKMKSWQYEVLLKMCRHPVLLVRVWNNNQFGNSLITPQTLYTHHLDLAFLDISNHLFKRNKGICLHQSGYS